jgi:hypothetical protein
MDRPVCAVDDLLDQNRTPVRYRTKETIEMAKYGPTDCHYRGGSYGSPKSAHCEAERLPKGLLCKEHEEAWRAGGRKPAAWKVKAATRKLEKPTTTKAKAKPPKAKESARDAKARKAVACTRCGAEKGAYCVWGKKPSKRAHADRLRLAEAVSTK